MCICIGCALVGSGHSFAQLLAGMALSGIGAAVGELTGLAGYEHPTRTCQNQADRPWQTSRSRSRKVSWLLARIGHSFRPAILPIPPLRRAVVAQRIEDRLALGAVVCFDIQRHCRHRPGVHLLSPQPHSCRGFLAHGHHQTHRLRWWRFVDYRTDSIVSSYSSQTYVCTI
jgi:hypothetical protein